MAVGHAERERDRPGSGEEKGEEKDDESKRDEEDVTDEEYVTDEEDVKHEEDEKEEHERDEVDKNDEKDEKDEVGEKEEDEKEEDENDENDKEDIGIVDSAVTFVSENTLSGRRMSTAEEKKRQDYEGGAVSQLQEDRDGGHGQTSMEIGEVSSPTSANSARSSAGADDRNEESDDRNIASVHTISAVSTISLGPPSPGARGCLEGDLAVVSDVAQDQGAQREDNRVAGENTSYPSFPSSSSLSVSTTISERNIPDLTSVASRASSDYFDSAVGIIHDYDSHDATNLGSGDNGAVVSPVMAPCATRQPGVGQGHGNEENITAPVVLPAADAVDITKREQGATSDHLSVPSVDEPVTAKDREQERVPGSSTRNNTDNTRWSKCGGSVIACPSPCGDVDGSSPPRGPTESAAEAVDFAAATESMAPLCSSPCSASFTPVDGGRLPARDSESSDFVRYPEEAMGSGANATTLDEAGDLARDMNTLGQCVGSEVNNAPPTTAVVQPLEDDGTSVGGGTSLGLEQATPHTACVTVRQDT